MRVEVEPGLTAIVTPAAVAFEEVIAVAADARLDAPIEATAARLRTSGHIESVTGAVRAMYRRLGIDPTRTRPSSEALLRRLRKGEGLPRINTLVDICNWCSVETQLPFGLYDRARIEGDLVTLRRGRDGEGYVGIRKDHVNVAGRLTIVDAEGPFGNPTSDSARTMVRLETTSVVFVIYAPSEVDASVRQRAVDLTTARMMTYGRRMGA